LRQSRARNRFIEEELAAASTDAELAVNSFSPETDALELALEEAAPSLEGLLDPKTNEAQLDVEFSMGPLVDLQLPYVEKFGEIVPNTFDEVRASLRNLTDDTFLDRGTLTAPKVAERSKSKSRNTVQKRTNPKPSSETVEVRAQAAPRPVPQVAAAPVQEFSASAFSPLAITASKSKAAAPSLPVGPRLAMALPSLPEVSESVPSLPVTRTAAVGDPASRVSKVVEQSLAIQRTPVVVPDPYEGLNQTSFETDLFGRVKLSAALEAWLAKEKGHLELYLQPLHSRDPQSTRYLSFHYPQDSFRESAAVLKGRYRLVAGVFRPGDIDSPYAEIEHPEEINAVTARSHIKFFADVKQFKILSAPDKGQRRQVQIHLSFFKGASPDYEVPTPIANAEVKVVGYPEYGVLKSDADGNLTIPHFPTHSQAVLEVRAKNYYRTFRTVPVFSGDARVPIYLVLKEQVKAITENLVRVKQAEGLSVAMGRVFDPETRNPLAGQEILLKDQPPQRGHYFRFFTPTFELSRTTTDTGFFSDFNMGSAFRFWKRVASSLRTFRHLILESAGYYFELGRGGQRAFEGRLVNPQGKGISDARVWLVGDEEFEVQTDDQGRFVIPAIDFQSGVIAIDVFAPGYRLTRHTVPWNPRQVRGAVDLFMVQESLVELSLETVYSQLQGPRPREVEKLGTILGGAHGALFDKADGCLRAELWSVNSGTQVSIDHGPFALRGSAADVLCLTRNHPGFNFVDLAPGEYLLKWKDDSKHALGSRVIHVGMGRDSVSVN
jgi:hypothetical protein